MLWTSFLLLPTLGDDGPRSVLVRRGQRCGHRLLLHGPEVAHWFGTSGTACVHGCPAGPHLQPREQCPVSITCAVYRGYSASRGLGHTLGVRVPSLCVFIYFLLWERCLCASGHVRGVAGLLNLLHYAAHGCGDGWVFHGLPMRATAPRGWWYLFRSCPPYVWPGAMWRLLDVVPVGCSGPA